MQREGEGEAKRGRLSAHYGQGFIGLSHACVSLDQLHCLHPPSSRKFYNFPTLHRRYGFR